MNELSIRKAMQFISEGKISDIDENVWEVNEHTVIRKVLPGRTLLSCDCEGSTRFCNSGYFCVHRQCVLLHEYLKLLSQIGR